MWRHGAIPLLGLALGIALAACGGGDSPTSPTPTLEATATSAKPSNERICQDLPTVALHYDGQSQDGQRVSLNWGSPDCAASAHPSTTVGIPVAVLKLPPGAGPQLTISHVPLTLDAAVRALRLDHATPVEGGLQMSLEKFAKNLPEPFDVETVAEQALHLPLLSPGEYILHVGAEWPDGRMGFAFRVEIVEPATP